MCGSERSRPPTLEAGKKYTYRVDLADGTSFTLTFGVR